MGKDKFKSKEDMVERLKALSGIKPINESEGKSHVLGNVELTKKGADGKTYAIVRENTTFFIKSSTSSKENLNESDFVYLGGLGNKNNYRYPSFADASKNLNMFMISLHEAFGDEEKEEDVVDAPAETQDTQEVPAGENTAADGEGSDVSVADIQTEPSAEAPVQDEVPAAEPSAEFGGEEMSAEPSAETPVASTTDDDSDLEDGTEDPIQEIQSMVGKLTQKVRSTEMTPEDTKAILNSVISSLNLAEVDPEERLVIAKRVKKAQKAEVDENQMVTESEKESKPGEETKESNKDQEKSKKAGIAKGEPNKGFSSKPFDILKEEAEAEPGEEKKEKNSDQEKSKKIGLAKGTVSKKTESEPFEVITEETEVEPAEEKTETNKDQAKSKKMGLAGGATASKSEKSAPFNILGEDAKRIEKLIESVIKNRK